MLFLLLALFTGQSPAAELPVTPDAVTRLAYLDCHDSTAPEDRRFVRYLSLHATPPDARPALRKAIAYAANATSFRSAFGKPRAIGDLLIKVNLKDYLWDYGSRKKRLAELERRGADFGLKDASARLRMLDPWEELGRLDPYFAANYRDPAGGLVIGWVDREVTNAFRQETYSSKPVLRADWVVGKLLLERGFGGIYSDLLMLPPKEADGYKALLIDDAATRRDDQLQMGGAVLSSPVALNNRELRLTYNPYPLGRGYYWETFDFDTDERGDKSVLERFAGSVVRDGRETIFSLPNALQAYRLFNGAGAAVDVVPESIAQVKEPLLPPRETRVMNSYKCIECHTSGVRSFDDIVRKAFLNPAVRLEIKAYDPYSAADLAETLESYYSLGLGRMIQSQQESYLTALKGACDMTGPEAATNVVSAVEVYRYDLVTPEAAAREMGLIPERSRLAMMSASLDYTLYGVKYKGNPQLAVLGSGQAIRRAAWEQSFADAMRGAMVVREALKSRPAK